MKLTLTNGTTYSSNPVNGTQSAAIPCHKGHLWKVNEQCNELTDLMASDIIWLCRVVNVLALGGEGKEAALYDYLQFQKKQGARDNPVVKELIDKLGDYEPL